MKAKFIDYMFDDELKNSRYASFVYYSFIVIALIMVLITLINLI